MLSLKVTFTRPSGFQCTYTQFVAFNHAEIVIELEAETTDPVTMLIEEPTLDNDLVEKPTDVSSEPTTAS